MKNYSQFVELFRDIATRHKMVHQFGYGNISDIDATTEKTPLLWITPTAASMGRGVNSRYATFELTFNIKVYDLVASDRFAEEYIQNDTIKILKDIVNEFSQHPWYMKSDFSLVNDTLDFTPFNQRFDGNYCGWEVNITLRTPNTDTFCGIPIVDIPSFELSDFCDCDQTSTTTYICSITAGENITIDQTGCAVEISAENRFTNASTLSGSTLSFTYNDDSGGYSVSLSGLTSPTPPLSDVLAVGNTTGANNIYVDNNQKIETPTIKFRSNTNNIIETDADNPLLHNFSNFFKGATDAAGFFDPLTTNDYVQILDTYADWNDGTGEYPRNVRYMVTQTGATTYREQGAWVSDSLDYNYYADHYMGVNSDGTNAYNILGVGGIDNSTFPYISNLNLNQGGSMLFRTGSNANGVYHCFNDQNTTISNYLRNDHAPSGKKVQGGMRLNPLERFSFQRLEEINVGSGTWYEQDFGFYGTEGPFGQRTSRFYHVTTPGIVNQIQIQNNNFKIGYKQNDTITRRTEINIGDSDITFTKRDINVLVMGNSGNVIRTATNNSDTLIENTTLKGLLKYNVDPKTTNGWDVRSIPDKQYVDDQVAAIPDPVFTMVSIDNTDSPYTAVYNNDISVNTTSGTTTVNLPTAVGNSGKDIQITKSTLDENHILVVPNGTEKIDGFDDIKIFNEYSTVIFRSNGTNFTIR